MERGGRRRRRGVAARAMLLLSAVLVLAMAAAAGGGGGEEEDSGERRLLKVWVDRVHGGGDDVEGDRRQLNFDDGDGGGGKEEEEEEEAGVDQRFLKLWTDRVHGGGDGEGGRQLDWDDDDGEEEAEAADGAAASIDVTALGTGCLRPSPAPEEGAAGSVVVTALGTGYPRPSPARRKRNVVSVDSFGAAGDGSADDTEAFMEAWKKACSVKDAVFLVPRGRRYKVGAARFMGPCEDRRMTVLIQGTVVAPEDPAGWDPSSPRLWLLFGGLVGARIQGGGVIDGSGSLWWAASCKIDKSKPCKAAPTAVTIDSCRGVRVKGLRIQNAQQMHLTVSRCRGVRVAGVEIEAPGDSPNTDGIHVAESTAVSITGCRIGTGDDCISISNASFAVRMKGIACGPGHGISIGSLGQGGSFAAVEGVSLDDARISGAQNGVRIKTWQGGSGYVRGVRFSNVLVDAVDHPIVIDQFYCDARTPCRNQTAAVRVTDVSYRNITGTSTRAEAIRFACSDAVPCSDIVLSNIDLLRDDGAEVQAVCNCAVGKNLGPVRPAADCLMNSDCAAAAASPPAALLHTEL